MKKETAMPLSPAAQAVLAALDDQFYELSSQHMAAAVTTLLAVFEELLLEDYKAARFILSIAEELEGAN